MADRRKKRASEKDIFYKTIPALAAYIDRIGAEQLNFRRFMIKDFKGKYYIERCLIRISDDLEIECSDEKYEPRPDEAKVITEALRKVDFPKPTTIRDADELTPLLNGYHYEFYDEQGFIIMVQERINLPDGSKAYIPWSFWDDGEWRSMEPDGGLPFHKPKKKSKPRIMVHEGAKPAFAMQQLVNDPEKLALHPWGKYLAQFDHWGIIGGALAPHRARYEELIKAKPLEVVYVCDNDWPGKNVLPAFSKNYGGQLKGIYFDERWPPSWDMADDMPEKGFYNGKRYVGPQMQELLTPATWATDVIPVGKSGKAYVARKNFKEDWIHSIEPEVFIHRSWPHKMLMADAFNSRVRPFSHVPDTAALLREDDVSKGLILKYDPSNKPGIFTNPTEGRFINTYSLPAILPEKGDVKPFLSFIDDLIEDETDKGNLLKWCATLIACPHIRMTYGVLLISEMQGVGKGTLGEKILAPLVGLLNTSFPSEKEMVDSNYNYWLAHKRLAVVHEIYAGHSSKAYNNLKSVITDKYVTVSKKFQAHYEIENWMHIFACSNSMRALQMSLDDRRWLVPKVTEDKKPWEYWQRLNHWLVMDNGLGKIAQWAKEYVKKHGHVMPGDNAPTSKTKEEVIEEGMSIGMQMVATVLAKIKEEVSNPIIIDKDLVQLIIDNVHQGRVPDRIERPLTLRKIAKSMGYIVLEARAHNLPGWAVIVGARVLVLDPADKGKTPSELSREDRKPVAIAEVWRKLSPV